MYKQIETERLFIRPINKEDKGFILNLLNTKGWRQFIGDRKVTDVETAELYIKKILDNNKYFYHVFEIKETKQPIGIITFLYRDNYKFPDIGFAILTEFEKMGYTLEASKNYLHEIKNDKLVKKIIAITLPENTNSIKLLEKLDLKFESKITDNSQVLNLYSITVENER